MLINQFFIYKIAFVIELLVVEHIFLFHLSKRKLFPLYLIIEILLMLLAAAFFPISPDNAFNIIITFISFLFLSILLQFLCYKEKFIIILYFCVIAYSVQFIAYCLDNIFVAWSGIKEDVFGIYTEEALSQGGGEARFTFSSIISFFIYSVVYYGFYLKFALNLKKGEEHIVKNNIITVLSLLTLVSNVIINAIVVFNVKNAINLTFIEFYSITLSLFTVYALFSSLKKNKNEEELRLVKKMLKDSKNNYELSKKNIEMINIKVHDLKHQIRHIGATNAISQKAIEEIEETVSIYDSQISTGNNALDIILTEKSLYCHKNKIKLTCIADGKLLSFLDEVEIYSLFGNLIDNAAHATKKIEQEDKRFIGLSIQNNKSFVTIDIHNFYEGEIRMGPDGFPLTTRSDKENHGFGYKSIVYLVKKYNGEISLSTDNGTFEVNIIFPIV